MSIRFINAARAITDANSVILASQSKASVSCFIRFNGTVTNADYAGFHLIQRGSENGFALYVQSVNDAEQKLTLRVIFRGTGGACGVNTIVLAGIVNHIAAVYDSADPSNQAVYINGSKYLMVPSQSTALQGSSLNWIIGNHGGSGYSRDWEIEHEGIWNGYILTLADIISIQEGTGNPSNIGLSATWRGWYKGDGTEGNNATAGDAAIGNSIDASWPLVPAIGAIPGSSVKYGAAMPFVSQTTYDTPIVYSSGKSVVLAAKALTGGSPLLITPDSAVSMPTIKINGGAPITLERPFYTNYHLGIQYFLPEGAKVDTGDSVTFSAEAGFFATQLGLAHESVDLPIINKSGVSVHGDEPKTIMIGTQFTAPFSGTYSFGQDIRNYALRPLINNGVIPPTAFRDDGTLKANVSAVALMDTAQANAIDKTCYPMLLGKWVVAWKPKDVGLATTVSLTSAIPGCYSELTDYRYDAATLGEYSFRVYDFFLRSWDITLAADCGPSDTTITVVDAINLKPGEGGKMWVKVEDEYMEVGATVNTTTDVAAVVRGTLGSTAASHASGTAGTTAWYRRNPGMRFSISGPGGEPNYEDLAILCPQDWTPPDPARPLTPSDFDLSQEFLLGPSKWVRDQLAGGSMINRYMAPVGTFFPATEIEDMRLDSDKWWYYGSHKFINMHIASFEEVTTASIPYILSHIAGETYSATLLADIVTSPAAGTIEDISISYTDTIGNQVIAGSRLLIGGEWFRVVSITGPASGATATVERGARSTTPTTHTAGVITVGWRVPLTENVTTGVNSVAVHATADSDHNLRAGMWAADKTALDMNPLARIAVTLTDDMNPGEFTAAVSVDVDKWQYIAQGLVIVFGSQPLTVVSSSQLAGTITFSAAASTLYATGTVGTGRSQGVFCKSTDDTVSAWSGSQASPIMFFPTGPRTAITFFSVNASGKTAKLAEDQTWDTTGHTVGGVDQASISWAMPRTTCSIEHTTRVTELCPGSIHWLNIPLLASDDLVDWIARKTRDGLTPGQHEVIVELANEVWNFFFSFTGVVQIFSYLAGYEFATQKYWWILRSKEVTDRIRAVFEETGRGNEVFLSMPYQSSQVGDVLAWSRDLGVDVDVASAAQYIYPGTTQAHIDAFNAADNEQCCDAWTFDLEYLTAGAQGTRMRQDKNSLATHRSLTSHPIRMIAYEGGMSTTLPVPYVGGHTDPSIFPHGLEKNRDVSLSPVFYHSHMDFFRICETIGDHDGVCLFNNCQQPGGVAAPGGGGAYQELWGITTWGGQQAGYGDGSDGKFDNRVCLFQPGLPGTKDPLTCVDENTVSVRLQSFIDYNLAYSPPSPPEHADVPRRIPTRTTRRARRNTTAIVARTAIVHEAPPPPPPSPVPVIGRRVIVFRTTLS